MPLLEPLSPEVKRRALVNQGYDPDRFDISDETFDVVPRSTPVPVPSQPIPDSSSQKHTASGTFGRNVATGIVPMLGGLASGAATSAVTAAPLEAIPPPFGQIAHGGATIMGGILGAITAAKGQEAILNQSDVGKEFLQQTAEANTEHPYAAISGNLAAQALGMRPSPSMVRDAVKAFGAGRGVVGSVGQVLASPAGQNIGIGAGLGAAQDIYDQTTSPEPFDVGKLLLNTLGGAALHRPTAIAQMVGVHPYMPGTAAAHEGMIPADELAYRELVKPRFTGDEHGNVQDTTSPNPEGPVRSLIESQRNPRAEDYVKARVEEALQANPDLMKARQLAAHPEARPEPIVTTETGKEIYPDYTGNMEADATANAQESAADLEMRRLEGNTRDRYQSPEQNHADVEEEKANLEQEHKVLSYEELKAQKESIELRKQKLKLAKDQLKRDREAIAKGNVEGIGQLPEQQVQPRTRENLVALNEARARQHQGVDFAYEPGQTITTPEGKQVYGYAEGANKVRATGTQPDTVTHEFSHILADELPAAQRAHIQSTMEKDPVVQRWISNERAQGREPGNGSITPEFEYLAQRSGDVDVKRMLERDSSVKKDLVSWYRSNFNSPKATTDDFARWLGNRFTHGRTSRGVEVGAIRTPIAQPVDQQREVDRTPFQNMREAVEGGPTKQPSLEEIRQGNEEARFKDTEPARNRYVRREDIQQQPTEDVGRNTEEGTRLYNEHYQKISEMMKDPNMDFESPEFKGVWRALEDTKNKYFGGHTPEGYQKSGGKRLSEVEQEPTDIDSIDTTRKGFFKPAEAQFDQAARVSIPAAESFKNFETRQDQYIGRAQELVSNLKKFDESNVKYVEEKMLEKWKTRDDSSIDVSGIKDGAAIYDTLKSYLGDIADIRRELGIKIEGREAGKNQNYIPSQLSDTALDLFVNRANTPEAKARKREWAQYIEDVTDKGIDFDTALKDVNAHVDALSGERNNYRSIDFGAIRRTAGLGLPESLREQNVIANLAKYGKRAAADLAFYQEIESKPEIRKILKLKNPDTNAFDEGVDTADNSVPQAKEIRDSMKVVLRNLGAQSGFNPKVNAFARLVTSAILGPATGVRDVLSIPVNTLPYMTRLGDFGAALKGIANVRNESANALRYAAKKPNLDRYQIGDLLEAPDRITATLNKGATLLRKWQGREALENFGRDITFSVGKELARNNILAASSGDVKAVEWLKKFGRLTEVDKIGELKGEELDHALNQMAKNLVDRVQGSYGGRGLPAAVMEGSLSPFLSLQKWGIEKSNVIYQDVYKPFMDGSNRLPMLTYLLGSVLTGEAIQELNKVLTGRKSQDADLKETLAEASTKNVVSELVTLMQLGNYAGIVSDSAKTISDIFVKGRTPRNMVSFPAATTVMDLEKKTADYAEALQQGTDVWDATKMYALDVLTHNIQAARMIANNTISKGDVERSDKFRDLRVYRELTGSPSGEPTQSNKYLDAESKNYKQTSDIGEAVELLPELMQKFQDKAKTEPEKAIRFLKGLKANSYQTAPSLKDNPSEFVSYYNYLVKTQGEKEAVNRIEDFVLQSNINKAKSSMVP